jgi:hypothetical protein
VHGEPFLFKAEQKPFPGGIIVFDFEIHNGADPGERVGKSAEQSAIAEAGYLDEKLLSALATIRAITDDNQFNDAEKIERIRTLLNTHEASVSDDGVKLAALKQELESELSEDDYYRILEGRSVHIQNRISPIIKAMTFQGEPGSRELLTAPRSSGFRRAYSKTRRLSVCHLSARVGRRRAAARQSRNRAVCAAIV